MIEIKSVEDYNKPLAITDKNYRIEAFIQYAHFKLNIHFTNRFENDQNLIDFGIKEITRTMVNDLSLVVTHTVEETNAELGNICSAAELEGIAIFLKLNTINVHDSSFVGFFKFFNFKRMDVLNCDKWIESIRDFNASITDSYDSYIAQTVKDFSSLLNLFGNLPMEKRLNVMKQYLLQDTDKQGVQAWDNRKDTFTVLCRAPSYLSYDYLSDTIDFIVANLILFPTITTDEIEAPLISEFFTSKADILSKLETFPYTEFDLWRADSVGKTLPKLLMKLYETCDENMHNRELFNLVRSPYGQHSLLCSISIYSSINIALNHKDVENKGVMLACSYLSPYHGNDVWELIAQKLLSFTLAATNDLIKDSFDSIPSSKTLARKVKHQLLTDQIQTLMDCCDADSNISASDYAELALNNEDVGKLPKATKSYIDSVAISPLVYLPEKTDVQLGFFDATSNVGTFS